MKETHKHHYYTAIPRNYWGILHDLKRICVLQS